MKTYSDNSSAEKYYQNVVVYGIYDGDRMKAIKRFTEALVDKLEDEGLQVKLVTKELEKHGLRRNPPILNKSDDTQSRIEGAVGAIDAGLLLVSKVGSIEEGGIGMDVVAVDVKSQEEFWMGTSTISQFYFIRNLNTRAGVKDMFEQMQKDGIFN